MDFLLPYHVYLHKYRYKYIALYHAFRESIVEGTLANGTKLPSSRDLANLYQISRGSVNQVYEMLAAEGYVRSEVGKGTFVSFEYQDVKTLHSDSMNKPLRLSEWGTRVQRLQDRGSRRNGNAGKGIRFSLGVPDLQHFPAAEWNRALHSQIRDMTEARFYAPYGSQGYSPLREAVASHLRRTRGIDAKADEIAIVNGSMQAIALLIQLLLNPGDRAIVENPGYRGTLQAIEAAGGVPVSVDVDANGIRFGRWPDARIVFVTPSRQFPTGAVLSLDRRQQILQWASEHDAYIIEDDYDSEFRRKGRPVEPLKVLDREDRVVYIGTFSKTMMPWLRVGYVVLPPKLTSPFCKAKNLYEPYPAGILEQSAIAAFMKNGQYERHLRRMKRVYGKKHEFLYFELQSKLSHLFEFVESDAGLHVFGRWKHSEKLYEEFKTSCAADGIDWVDVSSYYSANPFTAGCFGYSHLNEDEMREAIDRMVQIWKHCLAK